MTSTTRWTLRMGLGLLASGMGLVALGGLIAPESNLLGGLALVAAPLGMAGAVTLWVLAVAAVAERLLRRASGTRSELVRDH